PMAAYQSIIAYDGTDFAGFQRQKRRRTVQGVLEEALGRLGWTGRSLRSAGRTDTGAHARGQVVAFDLAWRREPEALTSALNAHLPPDVAVRRTGIAPDGFHPRYAARRRRYSYALVAAPHRDPLRERYAWRVWPAPDADAIEAACPLLVGRHDFRAFGPSPRPQATTWRTVYRSEWAAVGDGWVYRIEADAFLYRMVRRIMAALIDVGQGAVGLNELAALVEEPHRRWQGRLAPARGLCLDAVIFDADDEVR
ncbi:MAG TPA: tRNA pseudouridine(38-40) synthase TruA, partial [Anaerolineales bacterium]|nr:tRNA pseudouridine(38-40) synthase TruA [Anaerolineales bacterium]